MSLQKKARGIPQCINCQQLGHTKNFCNKQARCVKCAGNHHTKDCRKERNSTPTCVLCSQKGHTANYKGCSVYQNKLKAQQSKKETVVQRLKKATKPQESVKPSTSGLTYAQITKMSADKQTQGKTQTTGNNEPNITDMMLMLREFQTEMRNNFSQLANRVKQLEKAAKPSNKQAKKNKNE